MAIRQTTHVLKNTLFQNQALPSSGVLQGEPLVNLGDGILYFTGGTAGSPTWVESNNITPGYFEVGSNLYQLKIRDKIISYSGQTNLSGLFLSGTTSGFTLASISSIQGVDRYVTGGTLSTSATTNSNLQTTQLSYNLTPSGGPYNITTENTFTTGGTYNNSTRLITFLRNDGTTGYTIDLSTIDVNDTYVTGGTNTAATVNSPNATINLLYNQDVAPGTYTLPYSNVFLTGFTYSDNTFTLYDNSGNTFSQTVNSFSGLTIAGDLNVTGNTSLQSLTATTTNINGDLTVTGNTNLNALSATSVSISGLSSTQVVYVGPSGQLTGENAFTYTEGTNTLGVDNIQAAGDVVVQGSLTVFGSSISAFTTNLYVEDSNVTLNYNPTGSTTLTSVGAGWTIQDGSGIANTATTLNIGVSYNNVNLSPNTEYTANTGNENRNLFTQLGDIIIRNTNYDANSPNGKRVLAEGDVLDGGSY